MGLRYKGPEASGLGDDRGKGAETLEGAGGAEGTRAVVEVERANGEVDGVRGVGGSERGLAPGRKRGF